MTGTARRTIFSAIIVLTALANGLYAASPQQDEFTFKEHIEKRWRNQHVSVRFQPEAGVPAGSIKLIGPDGPVPVQLSEVEYGADNHLVKSANLHFIIPHLDPLEEKRFLARYGESAAGPRPESGLHVSKRGGGVHVDTGAFGAEFAVGQHRWDAPAKAEAVPGPIVRLRFQDGTLFGGSGLYGDTRVSRWSGECSARGPVFAQFDYYYQYVGGVEVQLTARVFSGGSAILWDMRTTGGELPGDGIRFNVSSGLPPLTFVFKGEFYSKRGSIVGREVEPGDLLSIPLEDYPRDWATKNVRSRPQPGMITRLTPWRDWWDDSTQTAIVLRIGAGTSSKSEENSVQALSVVRRNAGDWVEPAPPGTAVSHGSVYPRMIPLIKSPQGGISLQADLTGGRRSWTLNTYASTREKRDQQVDDKRLLDRARKTLVGHRLNRINHWVLDWSGDVDTHPHLYVSQSEIDEWRKSYEPEKGEIKTLIQRASLRSSNPPPWAPHSAHDRWTIQAWLLTDSEELAARLRFGDVLKNHLGLLGNYDVMRHGSRVAMMYDLMIDSDLISVEERPVLQAQMAYLAYYLASPSNWSMERGYMSGNLNMSVMHVLNLGVLAAAIPEHPMAEEWSAGALAMMDQWLDEKVGPAGEFRGPGESQANYAPVSAAMMVTYGIVATRAGFRDFVDDPRLRSLVTCLARQMTPPDVRFPSEDGVPVAGTPASGRGPKGQRHGLAGMMAGATAESDPEFSGVMQWSWNRTGNSTGYLQDKMAGLEEVYMEGELPAKTPDWDMDVFPYLGAIMRHGLGTDMEWYINFLLEPRSLTAFKSESGGFPGIWARGVPISVRFGGKGYGEREELLISRVLPAREVGSERERRHKLRGIGGKRRMVAASALPHQQYLSAKIPMKSRRRGGAHYDLVDLPEWPSMERKGRLPIDWQRQIMFVRADDPGGANYIVLRDTVGGQQPTMWQFWTLSEKIGTPAEVRDLDAFLAEKPGEQSRDARPLQGDRFTAVGQWGVDVEYYVASPSDTPRHTLRWGTGYHIPMKHTEYQDMLHLQLPGDGAYYVVLFPRDRNAPSPKFQKLGDGHILRIKGEFGEDILFVAAEPTEDEAGNVAFQGTAGSILQRRNGLTLNLGAKGRVRTGDITFTSDGPAALRRVSGKEVRLTLPADHEGTKVTVITPDSYHLSEDVPQGLELSTDETGADHVFVPAGIRTVSLAE